MGKASHTLKIPLHLETWEAKQISKRFLAHGHLYNAVLHELNHRIRTYHQNPISRLPNTESNLQKKYGLQDDLGISKYDAINITTRCIQLSGNHYLDAKTSQETGLRAWDAVQDYLKTRKNKPGTYNPYHNHTVYGMGSKQNLRLVVRKGSSSKRKSELQAETLVLNSPQSLGKQIADVHDLFVVWGNRKKSTLRLLVDWNSMTRPRRDYFLENLAHLKRVGITRDLIRGEWKYYLLLNLAASPYRSEGYSLTGTNIGLDTGPWQSHGLDSNGETTTFTPAQNEIVSFSKTEAKIARLQRKLDKSRRVNYPENYNADGTIKKGVKFDRRKRSNNAKQIGKDLAEVSRKRAAQKLNATRKTVKKVAKEYDTVIMEDCNYKAWQKRYGKAMHLHTPGLFHSLLAAELKRHGKELVLLPLKYTFSQTCICGNKKKKPLSQRLHSCSNKDCLLYGRSFHRDGFSALLMRLVHEYELTPNQLHDGILHDKFKFTAPPTGIATIEVFSPVVSNQPVAMVSDGSSSHSTVESPLGNNHLMGQPLW